MMPSDMTEQERARLRIQEKTEMLVSSAFLLNTRSMGSAQCADPCGCTKRTNAVTVRAVVACALAAAVLLFVPACGGKRKSNALCQAAADGNLGEVKSQLAQGADANGKDSEGDLPLNCAAEYGHLDVAKYLVSQGADIRATSRLGWTPMHSAAWKGHKDVVEYLVSKGADVSAKSIAIEYTPLHLAASNGHLEVVKYLISQGVNVSEKTVDGETPLDCAARSNREDVVEFLTRQEIRGEAPVTDGE